MKTLKYAWRFLMRSKSYTIINLLGLAFSLACSIILMRYIHRELTVDAHSVDPEHIIIPIRDIEGNLHPGSLRISDISIRCQCSTNLYDTSRSNRSNDLHPNSPITPLMVMFLPQYSNTFPIGFSLPNIFLTIK